MARSRDQTKQETREALIRAALALIPERGLDVSLDDVCDRAGYTRGAFYVHFEDRDALLAAVMERAGQPILDAILGAAGQPTGITVIVRRFLDALATGAYPLTRKGGVRPYQLLDACARSPAVRAQYVALVKSATLMVAEILREGQRRGDVRGDVRAADVAEIVLAMVIGVHTLVDLEAPVDLERASRSLIKLFSPEVGHGRAPKGRSRRGA